MGRLGRLDLKDKKAGLILCCYALVVLVAICVGILLVKQPVVPVVIVILLEIAAAVCLHHVELWIHAIVLIVELVIAALVSRLVLMAICVVLYIITILTLKYLVFNQK